MTFDPHGISTMDSCRMSYSKMAEENHNNKIILEESNRFSDVLYDSKVRRF